MGPRFQRPVDRMMRKVPQPSARWNPTLSTAQHGGTVQKQGATMKSLIAVTAIVVFTVATAVAGKPGAFATDKAIAAAKSKPVMMAAQQLPFDRQRSKN